MSAKSRDGIESALEWIYENIPKQKTEQEAPIEKKIASQEFDDV